MKFLKYLMDVIVYSCCLIGVATMILMACNYKLVSIKTGSMKPGIDIGDLCVVKGLSESVELRQGDIVTFSAGDAYVTHRIASDNGDGTYTTKGDANKVFDDKKLSRDDILGKVTFVVPSIGATVEYLSSKDGKIVLFAGLGILVTLSLILDIVVKQKDKPKAESE